MRLLVARLIVILVFVFFYLKVTRWRYSTKGSEDAGSACSPVDLLCHSEHIKDLGRNAAIIILVIIVVIVIEGNSLAHNDSAAHGSIHLNDATT